MFTVAERGAGTGAPTPAEKAGTWEYFPPSIVLSASADGCKAVSLWGLHRLATACLGFPRMVTGAMLSSPTALGLHLARACD